MSAKPIRQKIDKRDKDDDVDDPNRCFQHNYRIINVKAIHPPKNACPKCWRVFNRGTGKEKT